MFVQVGSVGGVSIVLARELRKLGYDAREYSTSPNIYYEPTVVTRFSLYWILLRAQVVHFQGRWKELPFGIRSSKVVFHYQGDELRHFRNWKPHTTGALRLAGSPDLVCGGDFFDKVPGDELPGLKYFLNPVDLELFMAPQNNNEGQQNDNPVILHSPENPRRLLKKGTAEIRAYLKTLEAQGYKFNYTEFRDVKHKEMPVLFQSGDIVIDQVLGGWHGLVSLEALAMGKPVVADILWDPKWLHNEDIFFKLTDLPQMLTDKKFRNSKRQRGMEYVKKYHAPDLVAKKLVDEYKAVGLVR
jgi:hypothetical protein